jgi:fructosamine-3-kinase
VESGGEAALLLEYLPMGGGTGKARYEDLGRGLARVHEKRKPAFGWHRDNWIGSTPQYNGFEEDWVTFWREKRLRPQIEWARDRGLRLRGAEELLEVLPAFFESYSPEPSLLHGDLWSGNVEFMDDGSPVIFDPATYYGDRETDLAMTEMYRRRRDLYNLYHLLNHYNLFGGGYGASAERTVTSLVRASGS